MLDVVLAALCLGIFFYHFGGTDIVLPFHIVLHKLLPSGRDLADAFFYISGFRIGLSLARRPIRSIGGLIHFYIRRLYRIIPSYYVVLFAAVPLLRYPTVLPNVWEYMFGMMTFQGYSVSLITLQHDPMFLSKTNAPLWFISIIVIYYLFTPVLFYLFQLVRRTPLLTIGMACLLGLTLRLIVYETHLPWRPEYLFEYMQLSLIGNAFFYITGMAVALGLPALKKVYRAPYRVGIALFVFWWILTSYTAVNMSQLPDMIFVLVLPMILIAIFTLFISAINDMKISNVGMAAYALRPLSYLGRISYQFYVWHWLIILYTWKYMPVPLFFAHYFGVLFICLSLTILLATGTYILFSPGHRVLRGRKPR